MSQNCFEFLDQWASGKKREPDAINNVNKMIRKHGFSDDKSLTCKTCEHLVRVQGNTKNYLKCELYGITKGEGTDWRAKWSACAKYKKEA